MSHYKMVEHIRQGEYNVRDVSLGIVSKEMVFEYN